MFESDLGKSYHRIVLEEAVALFSLNKDMFPRTCGHCLGTGKMIGTPVPDIPCTYCNGTGQQKKCGCGSGIRIGKDEPFCIKCKPQPKLDLSVLINHRPEIPHYRYSGGLYYYLPRRNP